MEPGVDWSGGIKFQVAHFGINRGVDKEELKITKTKTKTANMFCTSKRLLNESRGTKLTSEEMPLY